LSQAPPPPAPVYQERDRQDRHEREPTTPVVQQSNVVPNMATFTIQDSSNVEEETYYRAPGSQQPPQQQVPPTALDGNMNFASLDSLMADLGNIVKDDTKGSISSVQDKKQDNELIRLPNETKGSLSGLGIDTNSVSQCLYDHVLFHLGKDHEILADL